MTENYFFFKWTFKMEQWTFQIVRGRGSTSPSSGTCFWTAWLYWAHLFFVIVFSCWTISLDFGLRAGSRKNNQKMTVMKIYLSRRLFLVQARLPIALKFPIALHKDRKMLLLWSIGFSAIFQDMLPSLFSAKGWLWEAHKPVSTASTFCTVLYLSSLV